jgi:3-oxoacyl-[acyl-carrier-protein] synthase II
MRTATGERRVVITGAGAVTPLATEIGEIQSELMAGATGVRETTRFDTSGIPVKTSGEVVGYDPAEHGVSRRDMRTLDRYQQYALGASDAALTAAKLDLPRNEIVARTKSAQRYPRYGAAIGVAFSSTEVLAQQLEILKTRGARGVSPRLFNQTLPNSATSLLSVRHGLCGPLMTVSGASASGSDSIIAAYSLIRHGRAEVMLAGGAESPVTDIIVAGFAQNHTGSVGGACRPFDRHRDGTVLGEGAVVLVLEEYRHARARNAPILGELLGFGLRGDAYDMSDIPPAEAPGMTACLLEAIADAEISPREVGYLNAHGTATRANDPAEATAIRKVFGTHADELFVSGVKGATGHMLGASGAFEVLVALQAVASGEVVPTWGLRDPDPACELRHVIGTGVTAAIRFAISTSVGMGGNNSAIVVGAP